MEEGLFGPQPAVRMQVRIEKEEEGTKDFPTERVARMEKSTLFQTPLSFLGWGSGTPS